MPRKYALRYVSNNQEKSESFEKREDAPRIDHIGIYTRNEGGQLAHIIDLHPDTTTAEASDLLDIMNHKRGASNGHHSAG